MDPDKDAETAQRCVETRSQVSGSRYSSRSSRSSATSAAVRARAKAEAARAEVSYAEKEAKIMKEKAELEANLHVLQKQRAADAASAEAAVYEAAVESEEQLKDFSELAIQDAAQRTNEYVETHSVTQENQEQVHMQSISQASQQVPGSTCPQFTPGAPRFLHLYQSNTVQVSTPKVSVRDSKGYGAPQHSTHYANSPESSLRDYPMRPLETTDLTRHLIRRELVSSGLLTFDDCPENYWAWKTSFQSVTRDFNLTAREELDMLVKWLGPESSQQAKRIRSVHAHNPALGVQMAWHRLEECYGSSEVIEDALLKKLENFPKISNKDKEKLRELGDLLLEIDAAKSGGHLPGLAYLDTARGVKPIIEKLPYGLQEKWIAQGSKYKEDYHVSFPPFSFFTRFIVSQAKIKNDPSFTFSISNSQTSAKAEMSAAKYSNRSSVSVRKTDVSTVHRVFQRKSPEKQLIEPDSQCPIHNKPHPLSKCREFRSRHIDDRKRYLKENDICFRCCLTTQHYAKDCKFSIKCKECNSEEHTTALHPGPAPWVTEPPTEVSQQGGERKETTSTAIISKCTEICGSVIKPRSCSKICLVTVYPCGKPQSAVRMYAVLDDQSNRSLAKSKFFNAFGITGESFSYTLKTCSGTMEKTGRRASGFIVQSIDGKTQVELPTLIECDMMPDDRSEIPTPDVTQYFPHLKSVADKIPECDPDASILLLLGRDILSVHKVREQINGPLNMPYAQRLDLGWVIVGEVCLGGAHKPKDVSTFKTNVLLNGRPSLFEPCTNYMKIKDTFSAPKQEGCTASLCYLGVPTEETESSDDSVFARTPNDDKSAPSIEDGEFLRIMEEEMYIDETNHWVAPLPFRSNRRRLSNNRALAQKRFLSLQRSFQKNPEMKNHFVHFMQNIFDNDQAEPAPPLTQDEECWYLPTFGVYHPQKPGQIRVVFDSSAPYQGISLNDVLLSGPDLNNTLLGVLLRFRKEQVAISADIQQMFYSFVVREDHRNYLRFLWYKDNDTSKTLQNSE